jgi:probable phosphoglycerate mutase
VTTTVFLIRHMPHIHQGRVHVGRMDDVPLAEGAPERLAKLHARMGREQLDAVYASPILRAQLTAAAVAKAAGIEVQTRDGLTELDAGDWTGKAFTEFEDTPERRAWDQARAFNRTPGGESMLEIQARMIAVLEEVRGLHPDGRIALVSHGDPLKTIVLYILGMPVDAWNRFELDPGSVTTFVVGDWGAQLLRLNESVLE